MRRIITQLIAALIIIVAFSTSGNATCCSDEITEDDIAWDHMDNVQREGNCQCRYGYIVRTGTLVTVWEPIRIIETVKDPYCMLTDGEHNSDEAVEKGGTHSDTGAQEDHSVFQNVHIILPDYLMRSIMEVDARCVHSSLGNPMEYISEDDSAWNDDSIAEATYPLTSLFADYDLQMLCEYDSYTSQFGFSNPLLFWCMGSWGSTYPMSGHNNNDEYVTGNIALAARAIYIGARTGRIFDAASYYCYAGPMPLWIKHYFKLQPLRPTLKQYLIPIGMSSLLWDERLNADMDCGDNFAWVLWRKRWCCDSRGGQNFNTNR